ncbi:MAG: ATP-binding cassette domain-containing protein [Gammaproteobacteria bacterium]
MSTNAIQIEKLVKIFPPDKKAVDELDLEVREGEIMALLGPNGAGKTTTIRVLSTLSGFDRGKAFIAGIDVDVDPNKVRQTIGVVAQQTGVDYFLTGRENLLLQGQLYRMNKNDINARISELAKYFELEDILDRLVSTYSGGMRRKLDIATALIHRPKIIFLDEPTLGLDIRSRKTLWKHIEELNKEFGLTILLTTHYLEEADSLSHRVAIINSGKIQVIGTPDELKSGIRGDSVVITFESVEKNEQAFSFNAKNQDYVKETAWDGNKLHLYIPESGNCIPQLMVLASEHHIHIENLSLSRPSLDDVFLKYTGTSMLETKEETDDEWWKQWAGKGGENSKWAKKWQSYEEEDGESGDNNEQNQWQSAWQDNQEWNGNNEDESKSEPPTDSTWNRQQSDNDWPKDKRRSVENNDSEDETSWNDNNSQGQWKKDKKWEN